MAWVSGLVTLFAGAAIGLPGFVRYADQFTRAVQLAVEASDTPGAFPNMLLGPFAPLNFALGTPVGLTATYLCVTGAARAVMGYFDDPRGDPVLTMLDHAAHGAKRRISDTHDRRAGTTRRSGSARPVGQWRLGRYRGSLCFVVLAPKTGVGGGHVRPHLGRLVPHREALGHAATGGPANRLSPDRRATWRSTPERRRVRAP